MSETIEDAIRTLRELSDDEQDAAAAMIFAYVCGKDRDEIYVWKTRLLPIPIARVE